MKENGRRTLQYPSGTRCNEQIMQISSIRLNLMPTTTTVCLLDSHRQEHQREQHDLQFEHQQPAASPVADLSDEQRDGDKTVVEIELPDELMSGADLHLDTPNQNDGE